MSFRDERLLEKYKAISTYDRYNFDKVYIDFHGRNVAEDDIECESFTVMSIDFLLVYSNKYYLQVYFNNCAYKIVNKQMID